MAYYRASITLALSHSFARHNFAGAVFYAQAGACIGICGPGGTAVSRLCPYGVERPEGVFRRRGAASLRGLRSNRRISSVLCSIADSLTARRDDRHLRRNARGNFVLGDRNPSHNAKPFLIMAPRQGSPDRGRKTGRNDRSAHRRESLCSVQCRTWLIEHRLSTLCACRACSPLRWDRQHQGNRRSNDS